MRRAMRSCGRLLGPWVSVMVLAGAAVACGGREPAPAAPAQPTGPPSLDVVRVVERPLDVRLSLPAELAPYQSVAIYSRVNGFVKDVRVDRGSRVRAGDILAVLEAPELLAQRAEAQSRVQSAEATLGAVRSKSEADTTSYDRLKAAAATPGVVAGNELLIAEKAADAGRSQVAAAQQNVEAARQALTAIREMESFLEVRAPFAGIITERDVHPGALVGPAGAGSATPLVRLMEHDRLRVVVPVPQAYTAQVSVGTPVPFTVAAYPGEVFTGKVARVAQAVDPQTRTMAVELEVPNRDGRLAPGTLGQVQWTVARRGPSLLVPSAAVASTTDRTFVVRVRDGRTEWVDVRTGLTTGALVEVFGDLQAGDQVAGRGTDEVRPGTAVQVKEAKPAA